MCSFIFSTNKINNLEKVNYYTKFRGPDITTFEVINNHYFVHNLLSITGDFKPQPFIKNNIIVLYNGEIYNSDFYGNYDSDGECIIDSYLLHGIEFTKNLDGEFAIVLIDYNKQICIISSDTFKTKPIFYSLDDSSLGVSTYSTPLKEIGYKNILKFKPNTTLIIDLRTFKIISEFKVTEFDIKNQNKNTFEDWINSFENSISKRTKNLRENIFIGLSSGYDSGAICNELIKQKINFKSFILSGTEDENILSKRIEILKDNDKKYTVLHKKDTKLSESVLLIKNNTEEFKYTISSSSSDYNEFNLSLTDDGGSRHLSYICNVAKNENYKILISGSGPDELFSDYGFGGVKFYRHSNFGGKFPEDLTSIFPWNSFFGSSMESYIAKEEYVGGSYGIEVRYPFLDKNVVQEFLWLSVELKNKIYKSPIDNYLRVNKYPFNEGQKLGF
jgi:asparagine synthetase B (glutamine-hydrolysing)